MANKENSSLDNSPVPVESSFKSLLSFMESQKTAHYTLHPKSFDTNIYLHLTFNIPAFSSSRRWLFADTKSVPLCNSTLIYDFLGN